MTILLVTATEAEIAPFLAYLNRDWEENDGNIFSKNGKSIEILITGVGMLATSYSLTRQLVSRQGYELVLQVGIGGSYDRNLALGSIVLVESEILADLGAEDQYQFRDVFELGLGDKDAFPFIGGKLVNTLGGMTGAIQLPKVSGLTVNTTTGSAFSAEARWKKYGCTVESMEGGALHYVCLMEDVPFAQIRAVSNYVEARNREAWNIAGAIKSLNAWLTGFVG